MNELKLYAAITAGLLFVGSYVGLWWYRGHIDTLECNAVTTAMQLKAVQNQQAWTDVLTAVQGDHAQKEQENEDKLRTNQHVTDVAVAAAKRSNDQLQQRLAQLGGSGNQAGGASGRVQPSGAGIPVPPPDAGIGQVAHVASVLDADGLGASQDAAACSNKLTACEGWAVIVRSRMLAQPAAGSDPKLPSPSH